MNVGKAGLIGFVTGVLALAAVRLVVAPPPEAPHFHANFAIFVDGARVDLSGDRYMEEVGACQASAHIQPTERVHLHENNPDVVHVHHGGVTWGHLLDNLGFGLGAGYLALDDGRVLVDGEGGSLKLVVNGQPEFTVDNRLIRSGDRLLISYGSESEEEALRTQFPQVASNAEEYNQRYDPAGCSGAHGHTLWQRFRHAFVG